LRALSIRNEELVAFTQQFANVINAGIPLSRSLAALEQQEENKELRSIINQVRLDVEGGMILSEAFRRHPKTFSSFFVSMICAGEQGGGLSNVLNRIAEHLEKEESLKSKIKGVFTYPMVVGIFCILIIAFLVVVVAPVFAKVYSQLRVSLPLPTKLLLAISVFARKYWWIAGATTALLYAGYRRLKKKAITREFLDWLIMNFPILGKVFRKIAVARFVRAFGDMLACNVPLTDSLDIADKVAGNHEISNVTDKIRASVQTGGTLTSALSRNDIFPPIVVQMAYAGEESGTLGAILGKCAETLEQDIESSTRRMMVLLEPSLTLILAGIVGFIALAIYLPMFDLMRLVSQ
jgi:type IV pilus assembly protein PilC